jgi:hypothetical protein
MDVRDVPTPTAASSGSSASGTEGAATAAKGWDWRQMPLRRAVPTIVLAAAIIGGGIVVISWRLWWRQDGMGMPTALAASALALLVALVAAHAFTAPWRTAFGKVGRFWFPLAWVLLASGLVCYLGGGYPGPAVTDGPCSERLTTGDVQDKRSDEVWAFYNLPNRPDGLPATASPVALALTPDQPTTLKMGRSRTKRSLDVDYRPAASTTAAGAAGSTQVADPLAALDGKYLRVDVSQFRRSDDDARLNAGKVIGTARVLGGQVRVTLCVDRRSASLTNSALGDAGSYSGSISIIDPRISRIDLPVTVLLAYPAWPVVLLLVLAAILAAAWASYIAKAGKTDNATFEWRAWIASTTTSIGIISIFAGTAAALAAYNGTYLASDQWQARPQDAIALVGASFTAFLAATTALHVAGMAYGRGNDATGDNASGASGRGTPNPPGAPT